ncbi:MAG: Cytochrome c551 peroxidase (EC [uncultured Sulfurovum sp.]|uniref:Cytochrome c551 peroxidase (EC) n=1 Tax=uncultured Sulfurovum sp. TaxID=269237 RepID=A0A6S6SWR3_9BACT|nr:MAG: Cytochrome c551 peroxidase (EC [uncultured Sulfurovum sp.]
MIKTKLIGMSLLLSSVLFASNTTSLNTDEALLTKVKKAGIKSIPKSQTEINKLIDPNGIISEAKVNLGKQLYFEPRLSKSGIISCNTCHNLGLGGADGVAAAVGHKWMANPSHLNSPTVYNAVFYDSQFWDGRSHSLEHQAQGPMQAEPEMASPQELVIKRINSIPEYVDAFKNAYDKNVSIDFETITATIGLFERTLVTPSKFDDYLNGDKNALNKEEKEGLHLFVDKGCATCHNGIALGGKMMPFPIVKPYKFADLGDFKGDKNGMVKVPTLRNITETAPYFHNGAIWSLADSIKEMGSTQLGIEFSEAETKKLISFLKTLKGRKPEITYPQLPESSASTPKPDFN